jgi:hypothetical protein
MTDQDQDKDQDLGKIGSSRAPRTADKKADVEGHSTRATRATEDEADVEGHFSTIRSTGSKGE